MNRRGFLRRMGSAAGLVAAAPVALPAVARRVAETAPAASAEVRAAVNSGSGFALQRAGQRADILLDGKPLRLARALEDHAHDAGRGLFSRDAIILTAHGADDLAREWAALAKQAREMPAFPWGTLR